MQHKQVKEMPRRVGRRSVIVSVFLGHDSVYRCFLVVQETSEPDEPMFSAYLMHASGLDAPWVQHRKWFNISQRKTEELLREHLEKVTEVT